MKTNSLKYRITQYLKNHGDWVNSGQIERLAMEAGYKANNSGRRLRELENEGIVEVKYIKSKRGPKVAHYKIKNVPVKMKEASEFSDYELKRLVQG